MLEHLFKTPLFLYYQSSQYLLYNSFASALRFKGSFSKYSINVDIDCLQSLSSNSANETISENNKSSDFSLWCRT